MNCFRQTMNFILAHGYSHHIHSLMVVGLFALLFGVHPKKFHDWHLAMYVDAIDWVSLPNTLGMSQFGDGGPRRQQTILRQRQLYPPDEQFLLRLLL
jgi:deoxyribodipyrimidine photolyase-related protein